MQTTFTLQELRDKFAAEIRYHRQERDGYRCQNNKNLFLEKYLTPCVLEMRAKEREIKAREHQEHQRALIDMADRIGLRNWRGRHPLRRKDGNRPNHPIR